MRGSKCECVLTILGIVSHYPYYWEFCLSFLYSAFNYALLESLPLENGEIGKCDDIIHHKIIIICRGEQKYVNSLVIFNQPITVIAFVQVSFWVSAGITHGSNTCKIPRIYSKCINGILDDYKLTHQ